MTRALRWNRAVTVGAVQSGVAGTDPLGRKRPVAGDVLAIALAVSAATVAALGGWVGAAMGVAQLGAAIALLLRPDELGRWAAAALTLLPPPLAAVRHWTARLPLTCRCQRLPKPPPGLISLTGALVIGDLALIALTAWHATTSRRRARAEVR